LNELRLDFSDGFSEGRIAGLLPGRGARVGGGVGSLVENAPEKAAGGIERPRDGPGSPGLERGPVAVVAAVAVEFELKSGIGAVVSIIAGKLDFFHFSGLLESNLVEPK
jgi:hypothetical protein